MALAPAADRVVGSKYRLVRRLAGGGMGSVWVARHDTLDVDVAVKLMSPLLADTPTALGRFEREAKASAQLKSKNVIKVQDYGIEDGTPFMVMELLEGEDLGQRLARVGKLDLKELSRILSEIAKGLKVAHDAGIVHRDLKPSNVFLAREGDEEIVKICDFGIARETKTQLVEEKTSSGVVVGSPHHMSPEQAKGEPVDHRSDLWSLGVLVFRALTGEKPFDGEVMATIMLAVVSKPIPRATDLVPGLPTAVDAFVARALCRDVERRFQSAAEMSEALALIADGKDASHLLAEPSGATKVGREEPTQPESPPVSETAQSKTPKEVAPADATNSRELRAVTAGVTLGSAARSRLGRVVPWAALVLGVGALGFYFGRSGGDKTAAGASASPAPSVTETAGSAAPLVAPAAAPVPTVAPAGSAAPPITSASTAEPEPSAAKSAAPRQPASPQPPKKKSIDPFTGLPTP